MELVGPSTVVGAAVAALREQLLDGRLPAGLVLRDTVLADELGIARPTLRAAVQSLVVDGFLERDRGRSARVRSFTIDDLADLYDARTIVEVAAIDRVERDPSRLPLITSAMQDFEAVDRTSWRQVVEADVAFHRAIVRAASSPRLLAMFDGLANETRLAIALQRSLYEDANELVAEHRSIVNALRRKAFDSARKHLRAHFAQTVESLQQTATSTTARTS
jgi:DNA-binding GntR family transcriptional regulator